MSTWTQKSAIFRIGFIPENKKPGQLEIELGTELVIEGSSTPKM